MRERSLGIDVCRLRNSRPLAFRGVLTCQEPPNAPKTPWYFHPQFLCKHWEGFVIIYHLQVGAGGEKKETEIRTDWACSVSLYKRNQQRELLGHMTNGQGECVHAGRRRRRGKKEEQSVRDSLSFPQWRPSEKRARSDAPRQATFNQGEDSSQAPSAGSEHSFCLLMHELLPPLHPPPSVFSLLPAALRPRLKAALLFSLLEAEIYVEVPSWLKRRATTRLESQ